MAILREGPLLLWSHSRSQILATCERQFFFRYCADARWNSPDPRLRDLFLLKQLKSISVWKGDVIHQTVAEHFQYLKKYGHAQWGGRRLVGKAAMVASLGWGFSRTGRYRYRRRLKGHDFFAAIFEHEYKIKDAESSHEAEEHIRTCMWNFQELDRTHKISKAFLAGHNQLVEPPAWGDGATTFTLPGTKIMVKVDLAFQAADGRYLIFDWKTGKGDEDASAQLELYAIWAHNALGYPLDAISAYEVSLFKGTVSSVRLTEDAMFYRLGRVRKSSDLIQALVAPDGGTEPNIRDFSYARNVSTCQKCPFQRVCRRFP